MVKSIHKTVQIIGNKYPVVLKFSPASTAERKKPPQENRGVSNFDEPMDQSSLHFPLHDYPLCAEAGQARVNMKGCCFMMKRREERREKRAKKEPKHDPLGKGDRVGPNSPKLDLMELVP